MAKIIDTSKLTQVGSQWLYEGAAISSATQYQLYNGLDCCVTHEVFGVLEKQLREKNTPNEQAIYNFERALQGPALDMMLRGFLVDDFAKRQHIDSLQKELTRVQFLLDKFTYALWKAPLNPNSPKQLQAFFYELLQLPVQFLSDKGIKRPTTNREALEALQSYFITVPIINCIFAVRDLRKKISVLSTAVSSDGRMRSSWSPSATETGRWASSYDAFGDGTNLQNITPSLRCVFVADKGRKLIHVDQEQAESRIVGLLLWALLADRRYLDACEGGDLHTTVAKLIWPKVTSKLEAEQIFYRHFSYRDMSKRGGHLSNYRGSPWVMSSHLKLPLALCEEFQETYYRAFGLERWHQWVAKELQLNQRLETPLGHSRIFFGNPYDDKTLREAIAYVPQSVVAELTGLIILKVFEQYPTFELLTNDHDGVTWQIPDDRKVELDCIEKLKHLSLIPISLNGKTVTIPLEFSTGWNWASAEKPPFLTAEMIKRGEPSKNPDGLKKWRGKDERIRTTNLERIIQCAK